MPRLVHLNGPPGIGKSTLALRYVDDHPLAFCLDIDGFRRLIGRWDAHPKESGELARQMALAMLREHLAGGHDVVVPQFVARPEFVGRLADAAASAGARFFEIVLVAPRDEAEARFDSRASDPAWMTHHAEATRSMGASGGFVGLYDALLQSVDQLPGARLITTTTNDIDGAYRAVITALDSEEPRPD